MAKQLFVTKQIKAAILLAEIDSLHFAYFIDKRTNGRRYKFWGCEPSQVQIDKMNKLFKLANISAVASIAKTKGDASKMYNSTIYYTHNKLVVHVTNS